MLARIPDSCQGFLTVRPTSGPVTTRALSGRPLSHRHLADDAVLVDGSPVAQDTIFAAHRSSPRLPDFERLLLPGSAAS